MTSTLGFRPKAPGRITLAFGFSYISDRAVKEGFGIRQFSQQEMDEVVQWFQQHEPQPACAFCGARETRQWRWDHLIPVSEYGDRVLGNMVLACQTCDDSKGKRPFDQWMISSAAKSPFKRGVEDLAIRIQRLKDYQRVFGYRPTLLRERLTSEELLVLDRIQSELKRTQRELQQLLDSYRERLESQAGC